VLAAADGDNAICNWVCSDVPPELSLASSVRVSAADLTVNARVAVAPEVLATLVQDTAREVAAAYGLDHSVDELQSFRPGRPMPTHRMPIGTT
jgi:hypothetical protein